MRIFTISEANELILVIEPKLRQLVSAFARIDHYKRDAASAAAAARAGGGMSGGTGYIEALLESGRLMSEIVELEIEIKDPRIGLIDFPSERDGETVYLCWKLGESPFIEYWHRIEDGFAGRRPL